MTSLILTAVLFGAADDLDALQGKWKVVSMTRDGKEVTEMLDAIRSNEGGQYSLAPKKGAKVSGAFEVDASKEPKTMAMKPKGGSRYKGKTLHGIYKIEGDTLTICFAEPDKKPPTEFSSEPGSGMVLVVHERVKE